MFLHVCFHVNNIVLILCPRKQHNVNNQVTVVKVELLSQNILEGFYARLSLFSCSPGQCSCHGVVYSIGFRVSILFVSNVVLIVLRGYKIET
jgi:hypothetical protein